MLELTFDPRLDLTRSAARHGIGCFETLRVQDGAARWLALHLERLSTGCALLGMELPPAAPVLAAALAPALAPLERGVLRLLAVDDRLIAAPSAAPPPPPAPVRVGVAESLTRYSRSPTARFKALSYLENRLLQREAERRGLYDVVALNERGDLTDGGRSTLFVVQGGEVFTPPAADGALPGIARRVLLERGLAAEARLLPAALDAADGIFLASALRGVLPVRVDPGGRAAACAAALD